MPDLSGEPDVLLADAGYFSAANVALCEAADIEPLTAIRRDAHHLPLMERFADDPAPPVSRDKLVRLRIKQRQRPADHFTGYEGARSN